MSFEAESNSELTVIVPAYQLNFRFPVQNKIHKQKNLSDTRTGILVSIDGPCDFLPTRSDGPTNFQKSVHHYVIKFVSDLRQVGSFLRVLWFPPPRKLIITI